MKNETTGRKRKMGSYKKLLIYKAMKKKALCEKAGISTASATKMSKNGYVTTEILDKICTALDCDVEDIMEISHKVFGAGKVTWIDKAGKHIRVTFTAGEKTFIFPDAFKQGFLKLI